MGFFKNFKQHPKNESSKIKIFIYNHNIFVIFSAFIGLYFLMSLFFSVGYYIFIDNIPFKNILKFALLSSFGFHIDKNITNTDLFFIFNLMHQMASLFMSTIFTAVIVLKYLFLPKLFIKKQKCNVFQRDESIGRELVISVYNGSELFVTNCHIRVFLREEIMDNGAASLRNSKVPIFEHTYPFMDQYLVTRLKIPYQQHSDDKNIQDSYDILKRWLDSDEMLSSGKKLELIVLFEANVQSLDSSVFEVIRYVIDSDNMDDTISYKRYADISLDYNDISRSKGWENFEQ
jgi:hypothetical protein